MKRTFLTILLQTALTVAAMSFAGCSEAPSVTGAWLEQDMTRYETDPLRVSNGAYYHIDRHTVSFKADGTWHDAYQLGSLAWQYDGTWQEGDGTVITTDSRATETHSAVVGEVLILDGYSYEPLNECGIDCASR